jgi:hypothetical protein
MSRTRSHQLDLDDASAQNDLICAPQPIIIDQTQAAQIGGYARTRGLVSTSQSVLGMLIAPYRSVATQSSRTILV